ncbi:hypothetical protein BDN67DRAFT_915221, partial [Paxillus ammoniavirescens]
LVHWEGTTNEDRIWELESHLKNAPDAIHDFYNENPLAPRKLQMARALFDTLFTPYENNTETPEVWSSLEVEP